MSPPHCERILPKALRILPGGQLCAWCNPGIEWPRGHGICHDCERKELRKLHRRKAAGQYPSNLTDHLSVEERFAAYFAEDALLVKSS